MIGKIVGLVVCVTIIVLGVVFTNQDADNPVIAFVKENNYEQVAPMFFAGIMLACAVLSVEFGIRISKEFRRNRSEAAE